MKPFFLHSAARGAAFVLLCACALTLPADAASELTRTQTDKLSAAHTASSVSDGPEALSVGVLYVPPPFVGGSKVRTPETPDIALAETLAQSLGETLHPMAAQAPQDVMSLVVSGRLRAGLSRVTSADITPQNGLALVPTGYESRPMAIMRSDTDIKTWAQLKGRTVCVAQDGAYAGTLAARYGAVEKVVRAPADSLLALRTGGCDAAVHEQALLKPMIRLPEWKKFSASLPPGPSTSLVFVVNANDTAMLAATRTLVSQWRSERRLASLTERRVRDVAFEVYLDQAVPDCH